MKRSSPILRSPLRPSIRPILRLVPVKRENRKRKASEFTRCFGSKRRVAWVKALPSVVSDTGPCVNAHVRGGGGSRRADARFIVPLTRGEHNELHRVGRGFAQLVWRVDLDAEAAVIEARWQAHIGGAA